MKSQELLDLIKEFHREKLGMLKRHVAAARYVGNYDFNTELPLSLFAGPRVSAASPAQRAAFQFERGLLDDIEREGLVRPPALEEVRTEVAQVVEDRVMSGLDPLRVHFAALSEAARYNRGEGLRIGGGFTLRPEGNITMRISGGYAFGRFRFPGRNGLFIVMLATIVLPFQVTLIPSYAVYLQLGWVGTWLPLIVPHFFANAYNVFLLRQYFLTIPRELDEAAMIDGAGPLRILRSVIVPQAIPAIVAVTLFHFFWAWNEYFLPLVYLQSVPDLQPLSVGLARFNALYSQEPTLVQAGAIMAMALPVIVFFLAQRAFMRGVVFGGVEK